MELEMPVTVKEILTCDGDIDGIDLTYFFWDFGRLW